MQQCESGGGWAGLGSRGTAYCSSLLAKHAVKHAPAVQRVPLPPWCLQPAAGRRAPTQEQHFAPELVHAEDGHNGAGHVDSADDHRVQQRGIGAMADGLEQLGCVEPAGGGEGAVQAGW